MAYKISNKRPKTKGKGVVIIDDLNYQTWYDKEKFKLRPLKKGETMCSFGKKYTEENISDEKRNLGSYAKTKSVGKQLAKIKDVPAFDRGTGEYITPKTALIK